MLWLGDMWEAGDIRGDIVVGGRCIPDARYGLSSMPIVLGPVGWNPAGPAPDGAAPVM